MSFAIISLSREMPLISNRITEAMVRMLQIESNCTAFQRSLNPFKWSMASRSELEMSFGFEN